MLYKCVNVVGPLLSASCHVIITLQCVYLDFITESSVSLLLLSSPCVFDVIVCGMLYMSFIREATNVTCSFLILFLILVCVCTSVASVQFVEYMYTHF